MKNDQFVRVATIAIFCTVVGFIFIFFSVAIGDAVVRQLLFTSSVLSHEVRAEKYATNILVTGGLVAAFGLAISYFLLTRFDSIPIDVETEETL